ncbi:MAG: tubulin/FtsZ family protein [Halobacteriaceae archaeon]
MNAALIAIGQAGGKIAEALMAYERASETSFLTETIAVNTAKADLVSLERVPLENRVLVGQSRVKGHGVGADNRLGATVFQEDIDEVMNAVDDVPLHDVDAFFVVAALGGGTGSGGAPVVARELKRVYTEPVYAIGALPSRDEGGIYTLNAARSFRALVDEVDNAVLFDNDAWRQSGESLAVGYDRINEEMARRIGVLLSAGEVGAETTPQKIVDASEIINTLATGGITTIGYATSQLERRQRGLFGRSRGSVDESEAINRILSTTRRAALGRLTLPCEITSAERGLVVVSGPPEYLNRSGIEDAQRWLEEATGTMEIRGGDYPVRDTNYVASLVVLSGVTDVPRITELQRVAVETQRTMTELSERAPKALEDLLWEGGDELEPLF